MCNPRCNTAACNFDNGDCCTPAFQGRNLFPFHVWTHGQSGYDIKLFPYYTSKHVPTIPRFISGENRVIGGVLLTQQVLRLRLAKSVSSRYYLSAVLLVLFPIWKSRNSFSICPTVA
jgi:hypothetical protein